VDLNGTNRTIKSSMTTGTGVGYAQIEGEIRNSGSSPAGVIKTGDGRLILSAVNTYDGDTTVVEGSLQLNTINNNNELSEMVLESGARAILNFSGTDTIYRLMIDGVYQAAGEYGHTNSGADNGGLGVGALDAYFGNGNGKLSVTMGPPPPAGTVLIAK
jgi:autotransporter-associated beta strand protein